MLGEELLQISGGMRRRDKTFKNRKMNEADGDNEISTHSSPTRRERADRPFRESGGRLPENGVLLDKGEVNVYD